MSLHLNSARLARWQILLLQWSGGLLWLSGVAWLLVHHFGTVQGEFGPEVNPLEPWALRVHGAAMPVLMLGLGSLLVVHVVRGWTHRTQRWTGLALLVLLGLLAVSGYCLYYVAADGLRGPIGIMHWVIGIAVLPLFLWHRLRSRRRRRARADAATRDAPSLHG